MIYRSYNYLIVLILSAFFIVGCDSQPIGHDYWVDNPTNESITIKIDQKDYSIPANSGSNVNLSWGKHELSFNGEKINFFVQNSGSNKSFINPTQGTYVIYQSIYIDDKDPRATESYLDWLRNTYNHKIRLDIDGNQETLDLPFSVRNDIFIEYSKDSWDYFLDEALPKDMVLYSPIITRNNRQLRNDANYQAGAFQTTKKKIYRVNDFIEQQIKPFTEADVKIILAKPKYNDYQPFKIALTTIDQVQGNKYQDYLSNLQKNTNDLFQETDPSKVLQKKEELISVKATLETNKWRDDYMKEYPTIAGNSQEKDYAFNKATNEYSDQMSVTYGNTSMNIITLNFLVVE